MEHGEWSMEHGEWSMENGECGRDALYPVSRAFVSVRCHCVVAFCFEYMITLSGIMGV
jgi:hypothetical protein